MTLLVSAGFPQLAFDDDKNIQLVDGAKGKKLDPIAKSPAREKDPTFSPDATRVAYIAGGRVMLKDLAKPDATAIALTPDGDEYSDPAWAPTADVNLIAMARTKGDGHRPVHRPADQGRADAALHRRAEVPGRPLDPLGARRQDDHRLRRQPASSSEFGMFRWRSKKRVLARPERLGLRQAGHGHVEGQRGRARRRVVA